MDEKLQRYFNNDRFAAMCGLEIVECRPGYSRVQVQINDSHLNGAGYVHGGLLFTLADFCLGTAANAYGHIALRVNSNITFIAKSSGGTLIAEAVEIGRSNPLFTYDVNIFSETGELLAHFTGMAYKTQREIDI